MAKDKLGHGSEAHREGHKPQVEHGKYVKGSEYHNGYTIHGERNEGRNEFAVRTPSGNKLPLSHRTISGAEQYAGLHKRFGK